MSIKLLCLGDVMLGENINHFGRGIRSIFFNKYDTLITNNVKEKLFKNVDILFFNFEYSLVGNDHSFQDIDNSIYCSTVDSLDVFPKGIIKVVNVANNHFSQHGVERSLFTKEVLKENGYIIVGDSNEPVELKQNGMCLFFWGVSFISDNNYCGEYLYSDINDVFNRIKLPEKKNKNDRWLISLHWGEEYYFTHIKEQRLLAEKLAKKGFDIIIGHHPHVIHNTEIINDCIVVYSLGNFIFDQNFSRRTQIGLAEKIEISKDNENIINSFVTYQINYKVSKIRNIKEHKFFRVFINYNFSYLIRMIYRVLMKLELLINLNSISLETKQYYKNKLFK